MTDEELDGLIDFHRSSVNDEIHVALVELKGFRSGVPEGASPATKTAPTLNFTIFMAGDFEQARQVCREYCLEVGACVTVEPTTYIYTGGEEAGIRVGLINYPRFPSDVYGIKDRARELARRLMERLCQLSYTIVGPTETEWFSRRPNLGEEA